MDEASRAIPEQRELTAKEYRLTRWILEHGVPHAKPFLVQLERARVVSCCGCGCASVNFEVPGEAVPVAAPFLLGDFLYGEPDAPFGAFVFQRNGRLAGLEVYGLADDAPRELPAPESLRPHDSPPA